MSHFLKAAALDSSTVRGLSHCKSYSLHHSNNAFRAEGLEAAYAQAQAAGVQLLRVGAWMQATNPAPEVFDWAYLDRAAACARTLPTVLVLYHYDWPAWLSAESVVAGAAASDMHEAAQAVAQRYAGVFHSYVPMCEVNFQAHMMDCGRWFPNAGGKGSLAGPGHTWHLLETALLSTAEGLRWGDPACLIGTSEPFCAGTYDWNARPMDLLADAGLLDIVGANNYHFDQLGDAAAEARRRWPDKVLWLAESGDIWQRPGEPREPAAWYEQAERTGYEAMFWCPALPMLCFDWGHPVGNPLWEPHSKYHLSLIHI